MRKMRTFNEYLMEVLADREEAIGFIQAVLEEYYAFGSTAALLHGLRTAVEAQGGVSELAEQADIPQKSCHRHLTTKDSADRGTQNNLQSVRMQAVDRAVKNSELGRIRGVL